MVVIILPRSIDCARSNYPSKGVCHSCLWALHSSPLPTSHAYIYCYSVFMASQTCSSPLFLSSPMNASPDRLAAVATGSAGFVVPAHWFCDSGAFWGLGELLLTCHHRRWDEYSACFIYSGGRGKAGKQRSWAICTNKSRGFAGPLPCLWGKGQAPAHWWLWARWASNIPCKHKARRMAVILFVSYSHG